MNCSIAGWENVMEQRSQKLWQIALSIVLYQYRHFRATPGISFDENPWNVKDIDGNSVE